MKETMTPRERWQAVLHREKPDRIPMDYWATPEMEEKLLKHFGTDEPYDMYKKLHIDRPVVLEPEYVGPPLKDNTDWFGIGWDPVAYATGAYDEAVYNPLAKYNCLDELVDDYTWPDPDWFDYSGMPDLLKGKEEYPVEGPFSEAFYNYTNLRGLERAMMDLIEHPDMVNYCLDRIYEYEYERIVRALEAVPGKMTHCLVGEDFGSQNGLIYSPAQIRDFFLPRMKKLMALVHEGGAHVVTHSDGAVREAIPGLIEIGMDVLNPVQWRCPGMERKALKRDFGDTIIFHGTMDNQQTMPFGTPDDVRKEVMENLAIFAPDGIGLILAPCHNLQAVSPVENVIAMYETGYNEGWVR